MKLKHWSLLIIFILLTLLGKAEIQVGNSHNDYGKSIPVEPRNCYSYSQVIYLASEIQTSGTITQLAWEYGGDGMTNSNNWTIYIGHTSKTSFTSTTDWIPVSTMTEVWSGTFSDPGNGPKWIVFDIDDWTYNGTDNIVVAVDENEIHADDYHDTFYATSVSANRGIYYNGPSDCSINPDPANPPTATGLQSFVANIVFDGITLNHPKPTNLGQSNIYLNSADLNWDENGTAGKWNIEWKSGSDFTPGTGHATGTATVTSKPYQLTGLSANTLYYWYVRSDYRVEAGTVVSDWAGPNTFTTDNGRAVNPTPTSGEADISVTATTLDWNDVNGASGYHINIGTAQGTWNVVNNAAISGGTNSSYTYSNNWNYGQDYYWLVVTDYNTNQQVTGDEWTFFTCQNISPPYFQDFDNVTPSDIPSCMQTGNENNDSYHWQTTAGEYYSSPNSVEMPAGTTAAMNDWLFTKGINLDASHSYEISFSYKVADAAYPEKLLVDYGTDALASSMSGSPFFDENNITNSNWKNKKVTITPTSSGVWFFGFKGYSDAGSKGLYLDDISITEVATSTTWTGSSDGDWDNSGNWNNGVPVSTTDVTISSGSSHYPTLSHSVECNDLVVNSGAQLTIPQGKNLLVNGNLTNNAGAADFVIESDNNGNGSLIVAGTISGSFSVKRYIPAYSGSADGWHEIGCPVTTFSVSGTDWDPTVTGTNNDLYYLDESANLWMNYRNSAFDFSAGNGYLVANDAPITHTFTGTLNNSDVTVSNLSYGQGKGWHLLGNPFPCSIVWNDGNWGLTNVGGTAKVWDYASNPGNYSDLTANNIIPSTNGFFVQVEAGKTGEVVIPKAARTYNMSNNLKTAFVKNSSSTLLFEVSDNQNVFMDRCILGFREDATGKTDWDFDSHKLFGYNEAPQLWTTSGDEMFSTNYLPVTNRVDVPLNLKAGVNGTFKLSVSGQNSFGTNCEMYLEDLFTNATISLKNQSVYNFTAGVNDNPHRFVLHFYNITGVPAIEKSRKAPLIYCYNNRIIIKSNEKTLNGKVSVINLLGQTVYSTKVHSNFLSLSFYLNKGVYIVRYQQNNGAVQVAKVVL